MITGVGTHGLHDPPNRQLGWLSQLGVNHIDEPLFTEWVSLLILRVRDSIRVHCQSVPRIHPNHLFFVARMIKESKNEPPPAQACHSTAA